MTTKSSQVDWSRYPRGWFVVASSEELEAGQLKGLEYFGTKFVGYRAEDGQVHILDAYCPHLGADISVGGKVEGSCVRCPFHAWQFDGSGKCTEVPYAKKIPSKAKLDSHPVHEVNGLVFMHYDQDGHSPLYEIPEIEEYGAENWLPWATNMITIKTHPREVVENVADKAHFPTVHNTHVEVFDNVYEGHMATQITEGVAYPRGGGKDTFKLRATYHGPSYQITKMNGVIKSMYFQAHTPIDHNTLELRFGVSLQILGDVEKMKGFADQYVENLTLGYHEDVEIWEHKTYKDKPILCDGDGPVAQLRRWYKQFYEPIEEVVAESA